MGFSFMAVYQRFRNKGSGNKAAVLIIFYNLKGSKL